MTNPSPISGLAEKPERYMRAYYHEFTPTGCDPVDAILEAVAMAGKAYHSTELWDEAEHLGAEGYWTLIQSRANEAAAALASPLPVAAQGGDALHIVFDGPPDRDGGRFVEVETPDGRSVNIGEWHRRPDNLWELRIPSNVNLLRRAMDYLSDIYNPEDEALYRLRNDIEASLTKTAAPLGVEPTDEQVNLAAEVIWNDRDARMGGPWNLRNPDEVVVLQTKATARAVLKAAALPIPAPDAQAVAWRWAWNSGDEPGVWTYSETRPDPHDKTIQPLYDRPVTGEADVERLTRERDELRLLVGELNGQKPLQDLMKINNDLLARIATAKAEAFEEAAQIAEDMDARDADHFTIVEIVAAIRSRAASKGGSNG